MDSTYEDCISSKIKNANSDLAVLEIKSVCARKFEGKSIFSPIQLPKKDIDNIIVTPIEAIPPHSNTCPPRGCKPIFEEIMDRMNAGLYSSAKINITNNTKWNITKIFISINKNQECEISLEPEIIYNDSKTITAPCPAYNNYNISIEKAIGYIH